MAEEDVSSSQHYELFDGVEKVDSPPVDPETGTVSGRHKRTLSASKQEDEGIKDKEEEKKVYRLVRNREAAQRFRKLQKIKIESMDAKIKELELANSDYQAKLATLTAENKAIKEHLEYLRSFLEHAVSMTFGSTDVALSAVQPHSDAEPPNGA